MERTGRKYLPTEIFDLVDYSKCNDKAKGKPTVIRVDLDGHLINVNSLRLHIFKLKGIRCVKCGISGTFFIKERTPLKPNSKRQDDFYHLNLYAVVDDREILMTKDHIIPKSKGGSNQIENLQTMCVNCNHVKGDE
jgi:5-methylcytosine-specific restriction endonuclease McrA